MYGSPQDRLRYFFNSSGCPVTLTLLAINIVSFFAFAIAGPGNPLGWLVFATPLWPERFWTLLTWPLVGAGHPFILLLTLLWGFWVCGSLERSWGTRAFSLFFFAQAALMGLAVWLGTRLLGGAVPLAGMHFAVAGPTIAWAAVNKRESIMLYGIIPLSAPILAGLTLLIVWYEISMYGSALLGLFGLAGCLFAWWYAQYGRYAYQGYAAVGKGRGRERQPKLRLETVEEEAPRRSPLAWWKARREQKKLADLWNRSFDREEKK